MRSIFTVLVFLLCILLVSFSQSSMLGAARGFELFVSSVFPALFPFFVCVSALKRMGAFATDNSKPTAVILKIFAVSCISGSPSGTLLTDNTFGGDINTLDLKKRSILSAITNLSSPVFIVGTVCTQMLKMPQLAYLIGFCHYGAAFLMLLVFILFNRKKLETLSSAVRKYSSSINSRSAVPLSTVIPSAIMDSVNTMLRIGGTLIFCMVLIGILDAFRFINMLNPILRGISFGLLEMTNGINFISGTGLDLHTKCCLITALLSFGGFCVYMQASGVAKVLPREYLITKLIHGISSASLAYVLFPFFINNSSPVSTILGDRLVLSRIITMGEMVICGIFASSAAALMAIFAAKRTKS